MVTLFYWMMLLGGLVSLVGGALLLVKGDAIRAADAKAGRVGPNYPTPEAQKRLAVLLTAIGAVFVAAALFLF